ncbi:NAD-dependent epimerase/dehydratase family protein [Mangrovimonas sp. CR14]|uniref:NAD-dependent epimerase/dehydratase family protein n=1 Tax=Mangrovimonas sp. CR14 TaxID=2706120 RepID=UPI00351B6066
MYKILKFNWSKDKNTTRITEPFNRILYFSFMILVTGGTGLVGAHLLYHLVKKGESVRAIFRSENKLSVTKKVFSYYESNFELLWNQIDWVHADLLDIPKLSEAFKNVEYVYHCAAMVSFDPDCYHQLRKTNIEGTANIVNLCIANNIKKICYVSSVATLGKTPNNTPITEETAWNPEADNNVYAITKYGAEIEVWRGTQEGLNAVIVNPGVILGGGNWDQGSGIIFKKAFEGNKYYTKGGTGYVDVQDVVNIMMLLMSSNIQNETYILVADHLSSHDILSKISTYLKIPKPTKEVSQWMLEIGWRMDWLKTKLTGKERLLTKQLAKTLNTPSFYSNSKIVQELNYEFTPIDQTIQRVCNEFLIDN